MSSLCLKLNSVRLNANYLYKRQSPSWDHGDSYVYGLCFPLMMAEIFSTRASLSGTLHIISRYYCSRCSQLLILSWCLRCLQGFGKADEGSCIQESICGPFSFWEPGVLASEGSLPRTRMLQISPGGLKQSWI